MSQNFRSWRSSEVVTLVAIVALAGLAAMVALEFPARARIYPLVVSLAVLILAVVSLTRSQPHVADKAKAADAVTTENVVAELRRALPYLGAVLGLYVLTALVGLVVASGVFVTVFLVRYGSVRLTRALPLGVAVVVGLGILGMILNLRWPASLFDVMELFG